MKGNRAGKWDEHFFADAIPIEPVLGEMDYTNTREVGYNTDIYES